VGRMEDKVVLVTGAGRGIGAACARLLASEGAQVVLSDVREEQLTELANELRGDGASAQTVVLDVSKESDWTEAVRTVESAFGALDVLLNNAGVCYIEGVDATTAEIWDHTVAVNQKGVWLGMRAVTPAMRRRGGGSIVNVSSIFGLVGGGLATAYQGTKGAVRLLTKSAAVELAPDKIRVNSVHPGFIDTELAAGLADDELRAGLEAMTPLGRYGQPQEIAAGVLYLASDESSFVTGSELVIDGGYTAR
jgi:cyclopentanol dehydrogenase